MTFKTQSAGKKTKFTRCIMMLPIIGSAILLSGVPATALANNNEMSIPASIKTHDMSPVLKEAEKLRYRAILSAIRSGQWAEAERMLNTGKAGVLDPFLRAELVLAPKSPQFDAGVIGNLLPAVRDLPQASRLSDLAKRRGVSKTVSLPAINNLRWLGESPRRYNGDATKGDSAAAELNRKARPLIKDNRASEAEALYQAALPRLSPAGATEWQQRLAWAYYTENKPEDAMRLAQLASSGSGDWGAQGQWTSGLLHWRSGKYIEAAAAFDAVATRGDGDAELVAAALYWSARAHLAMGKPQGVQGRLLSAAQFDQSFYGLLAAESLGKKPASDATAKDFALPAFSNAQVATALTEIGERTLADQIIRHQARIGSADDHDALVALAGKLSLPETQFYLSHNGPRGTVLGRFARYPAPKWQPESGWRVDSSLVFAHGLQESSFRTSAVSAAGAKGVMQVLPSTARYMAGKPGATVESANLFDPSVNLEYGQSYLEYLNRNSATGGKLPKIIAAYNAGLTPVARWNTQVGADDDPLLYIESIPYWETRGYVVAVLRNYWMYQEQSGDRMKTRADLAQRAWPQFPGAGNVVRTADRK
jgi:soluble lytic murein transglycosylase